MQEEQFAHIGIGSNLGNRVENYHRAIQKIAYLPGVKLVAQSSPYENKAQTKESQPDYINGVIKIKTDFSPQELLRKLTEIEESMGRERPYPGAPRIIDLDLLFYGNFIIEEGNLILPHPRAHQRGFVLVPLSEIEPEFVHPTIKISIRELLQQLKERRVPF